MDTFDLLAKVVVVGDSTVGKTCLILRYTQDIFRENFLPTIGVDFKTKLLNMSGKRYKLQLWDTAGQERYDSLRRGFYRGAKGVVIVYDITKIQSFDNVTKWMEDITTNTIGSKCPTLLLIGNKCDLEEQRKILTETGEDLARSYGASFGECSAKDGNGVDEAFQGFVNKLSQQMEKDHSEVYTLGSGQSVDISRDWCSTDETSSACCSGNRQPTSPKEKVPDTEVY